MTRKRFKVEALPVEHIDFIDAYLIGHRFRCIPELIELLKGRGIDDIGANALRRYAEDLRLRRQEERRLERVERLTAARERLLSRLTEKNEKDAAHGAPPER